MNVVVSALDQAPRTIQRSPIHHGKVFSNVVKSLVPSRLRPPWITSSTI